MHEIINFFVGFISTTIGAVSGIGGGVIIKPVLDMLGQYDISSIGVLSSLTVFSMSVVSLWRNFKNKVKIDINRTVSLAIGSIAGGIIGDYLFTIFLNTVSSEILAQKIQSIILLVLMLIILTLYTNEDKIKGLKIQNIFACIVAGVILGIVSSFLGIGGGPLNVIVLMYILGMNTKEAAINSIVIIFFSQSSKLTSILLSKGFKSYNLEVAIYMIIGGILGGYIGSNLSRVLKNNQIKNIFKYCMVVIICFNIYNIIK